MKEQRKAAYAVVRALQADELVYPEVCELCGDQRKTIAHHWNGHTDAFNIWFICKGCSGKLHHYEFHLGLVTKAEAKSIIMLNQFSQIAKARKVMDRIEWLIYEPLDHHKAMGVKRTADRCAYKIYERDGVIPHQCSRWPKETVEGYGFCTQHAKIVRGYLNR